MVFQTNQIDLLKFINFFPIIINKKINNSNIFTVIISKLFDGGKLFFNNQNNSFPILLAMAILYDGVNHKIFPVLLFLLHISAASSLDL